MSKQREALKIALEVLDSKHNFNSAEWRVLHYRAFQAIREALAEPEQEPVADSDLYAVWLNGFHSRKPLTDKQIDAEFDRECYVTVTFADGTRGIALDKVTARDFARAIERAHGIGGEA
jgi:hypothetical protein